MNQRVARLQQDARQPHLAMEADGQADTKTRERTEGAATAVQVMHGDSYSANRIVPCPETTSTSFGVKAVPPALPCRDDALVENGAAAPKSCHPPLEMRTATAAGGLFPTGKASIATRTNFNQPPLRLERGDDFQEDINSIRLIRQQLLEGLPACCPLLPEGH